MAVRNRGQLKLPPGQVGPRRSVQSKRFISKLMVLTAIAKPNPEKNFDGKIGCFVFAQEENAKRKSKNRDKGTVVLQPIPVTGDVWAETMTAKVFPAIRRKMSWLNQVNVQFDNARPHTKASIQAKLLSAARNKRGPDGLEIKLSPQPAQSPDLNLNDLGFYSSLDTFIGNNRSFNLLKLWDQISNAFLNYDSTKLTKLVETKRNVVAKVLEHCGDNDYKLPHGKKPPRNRH
jgi:hypothetical protein